MSDEAKAWLPYMSLTEAEWVGQLKEWDLSRLAYEYRNSQDRGFLSLVVKELERRDAGCANLHDAAAGLAAALEALLTALNQDGGEPRRATVPVAMVAARRALRLYREGAS